MKRIIDTVKRCLLGLILVGIPLSMVYGGTGNIKIQPYVTIQEEYNDNINLTSKDQKKELISTVYPGIKISGADSTYGFDLNYRLGVFFYASSPEYNYISHTGKLNTWVKLNPRWTFRLKEDLLRSEDPWERDYYDAALENQSYYSINRQRAIYLRNTVEPSVEYQFGKDDRFILTYRNNIYQTQNQQSQGSQENSIKTNFSYWFNIKNGIVLDYNYTQGVFEHSPDLKSHLAKIRYLYRLSPRTTFYGEYSFLNNEFQSPGINYAVHNPIFGIDHAFSPTLSGSAQAGYFWKNSDQGTADGYSYKAALTKKDSKTIYNLSVQGGFTQDYFTAQNLGFVRYNRAVGKITHQLRERMTLGISGLLERAEFDFNRTDWIWGVMGTASYQLLKWLTLSLEASHREDNSNVDLNSFGENRVMFKLTAIY